MKVLSIGNASYDVSVVVDDFIKEKDDIWFDNKVGCGSGTASNIAYALSSWGLDTTFTGVIGNDANGNKIKTEMGKVRIDTRFIEMSFEKDTIINTKIITKSTGESTNITLADEFSKLKKFEYDFTPDIIITDGYDCYAAKNAIAKYPKAISLLKAKFATKEVLELTKFVKNIVCSISFAEKVSGVKADFNQMSSLATIYFKMKAKIPQAEIVITLGEKGSLYCFNNEIKISPAYKTAIVDTTAAGDVFAAGFAYILVNNGDIEKAAKYGNIAAGLSLDKIGIKNAIPSLEQVEKLYVQNYE